MAKEHNVRKKKKRKKKNYLLRLFLIVAIGIGLYFLMDTSFFDVQKINVAGNNYYTKQQVIDKAGIKNGTNIFFEMKTKAAKNKLLQDPYIKNVKVGRRPPATIIIKVEERKDAAAVMYGTSYFVIDKEGMVLKKTDKAPKVTLLSGIVMKTAEVGKPLEAEENLLLTDTMQMIGTMEESEIYFKKIEISNVMIGAYIYDQLLVYGTPEAVVENMESGNLQQVLYKLHEQGIERGIIRVGTDGYCSFSAEIPN